MAEFLRQQSAASAARREWRRQRAEGLVVRVRLKNLQKAPELNGQEGVRGDYLVAEGRWKVRLNDGGRV